VDERQPRVHLDRKQPIRRGDENAAAGNTEALADHQALVGVASHVLDDGTRVHVVERAIAERHAGGASMDEAKAGIPSLEVGRILQAEAGDPVLEGIELLEIVR
jgi:hypothetical protein